MKKLILTLLSVITFSMVFAQAPNKMSYQAVVRNSQNALVSSQSVGMRVSILQGTASGSAVYVETHTTTTNNNGLASIEIGGGTPVTSTFSAINWVKGPYFVKTETDPTGGTNYSISGTSQLLSVPYALFAGNVANNGGKQTLVLSDDVTDAQAAAIIAAEVGPNTQEIKIIGTTQLTQVDLSMIKTAISIVVENNESLTSVNLSGLTRMDGDLVFSDCPLLSNLNLSSLEKVTTGQVDVENTGLTNLNLTNLQKLNGGIRIDKNSKLASISLFMTKLSNYLSIDDNPILTSISFSNLTTMIEGIGISDNAKLSSISFPVLTTADYVSFNRNTALSSVSFPMLTTLTAGGITLSNNASLTSFSANQLTTVKHFSVGNNPLLLSFVFPALTTITVSDSYNYINGSSITANPFPALTSYGGGELNMSNNKLTSDAVNSILARLVSISPALTGKYFSLNSQTPAAPPTGAGLTNKQTLINNGNPVWTD